MTEFQELIKDAPKFDSMERGELVAYAYAMYAAGAKADTENAKLRELCVKALEWLRWAGGITCPPEVPDEFAEELRELGIEVDW